MQTKRKLKTNDRVKEWIASYKILVLIATRGSQDSYNHFYDSYLRVFIAREICKKFIQFQKNFSRNFPLTWRWRIKY